MADAAVETGRRRARGGGGAARRAERTAVRIEAARYITRNIPNFEILSEEALQIIEANAEIVLEEIGVNFVDNPEALARWKEAGADVRGERVHIPPGLARKLCSTAPSSFTQHARNPDRNVEIGGKSLVLAPVYGPPFVRDADGGRRYATMEDFQKFVKLGYMSKWLHHSGGTVCEPTDIPVNKRHLDMLLAHMTLSDKPFMGSVTEPSRAEDSIAMCKILFGDDFVDQNAVMTSLININSPLTFDNVMMGALEVYARAGQACIVSPFIVGGAMAPVSVTGTLTQVLAEAMAGIAYSQLVRPGAPVIFGRLRFIDRHEFGRTDLRNSGSLQDPLRCRAACPPPEPALPVWRQFVRVQIARRPGGLRNGQHLERSLAGRRELHAARLWLAGRRAGVVLREIRAGCRSTGCVALGRGRCRHYRKCPGHGRDPRGWPRRALSGVRTHAVEF